MVEGMLPGFWMCGGCVFFLDVQEVGEASVWQYRSEAGGEMVLVPGGCLLVVGEVV